MLKWIAGGLVTLTLVGSASSALAAYPGANGRIAFYRADGSIYSIKADGTDLRKLGPGSTPSYSPNGARIAFALSGEIWTMNADGSNRQRVTRLASYESDPTWSPDGTRLAFVSDRNGGGIFTLRATAPYGTLIRVEATPVSPDESFFAIDYAPAWATNGLIYFTRFTDYEGFCTDPTDTMSVNPSTKAVREWMFLAKNVDPAPRSRSMVYHYAWGDGSCNTADGIYIANIDGSNPHPVTPLRDTLPLDSDPVFSPDATKVAFQRGRYVYTVNANGTGLRRLALGSAPSWQPR